MPLTLSKGYSSWGADMGRRDIMPEDPSKPIKLWLQRLKWVDGDYDQGGAYWGHIPGDSIYCAWSNDGAENDTGVRIYVRAKTKQQAKDEVLALLPTALF